jgi:hypothetical protein
VLRVLIDGGDFVEVRAEGGFRPDEEVLEVEVVFVAELLAVGEGGDEPVELVAGGEAVLFEKVVGGGGTLTDDEAVCVGELGLDGEAVGEVGGVGGVGVGGWMLLAHYLNSNCYYIRGKGI